jgi:GAF domain-containing protein
LGENRRHRSSAVADPEERVDCLLDVGKPLLAGRGQEAALKSILHHARKLTGARYAALGVLDEHRLGLQRFLTLGVDGATRRRIDEPPRGRGVLGALIDDPRPLLIPDIRKHPGYYGFPPGHPEMHSFLGVPILIHERAWGNLYLADKRNGAHFTAQDVQTATALAQWAAIAIDAARLHAKPERRYEELGRGDRPLETAWDMTGGIGGAADLEGMLEFIVKRARDIIGAQGLLIMLREGDELLVAACAGLAQAARGRRFPLAGSMPGQVLERGQPLLVADVASELQIDPAAFGLPDADVALLVPMLHRDAGIGVFAAFDQGGGEFTDEDVGLLRAFAHSTADAVATGAA